MRLVELGKLLPPFQKPVEKNTRRIAHLAVYAHDTLLLLREGRVKIGFGTVWMLRHRKL